MTIWVDADATPRAIRDVLLRAAARRGVEVVMVANRWLDSPKLATVRNALVPAGADAADDYIVAHCAAGDLVVTADVPLAARVVERGAVALQPRGRLLDASNVREFLSIRDFHDELRAGGEQTGGPAAFDKGDLQRFSNALDRWLTAGRR